MDLKNFFVEAPPVLEFCPKSIFQNKRIALAIRRLRRLSLGLIKKAPEGRVGGVGSHMPSTESCKTPMRSKHHLFSIVVFINFWGFFFRIS